MNHCPRATHPARVGPLLLLALVAALAASTALRLHAQAVQEAPRTVLYLHGRIYTNDPQHPWAQGMGVRDGKIICVGAISQVMLECGCGEGHAETIDLHEKFVIPPFNDAHVHLGYVAPVILARTLYGPSSSDELKTLLPARRPSI